MKTFIMTLRTRRCWLGATNWRQTTSIVSVSSPPPPPHEATASGECCADWLDADAVLHSVVTAFCVAVKYVEINRKENPYLLQSLYTAV
jgi:hypothetical protein